MSDPMLEKNAARLVDVRILAAFDVLGPTIQFLSADEGKNDPSVMRGIIAPGVAVPLHSHPEPEIFIAISGRIEGLKESDGKFGWVSIAPGDVFQVPGWAKHAFRNQSSEPANFVIAAPASIGRFFREVITPVAPGAQRLGPPSQKAIQHFMATAERFGYCNATPEENAEVGIFLSPPA